MPPPAAAAAVLPSGARVAISRDVLSRTRLSFGGHRWGNIILKKMLPISSSSHQPRSAPEVGSGVKMFFVFFTHF